MLALNLVGCASAGSSSAVQPSVTTFASKGKGDYLAAIKIDARFEERDGCLYVGGDQAVWFFGTTIRQTPGATSYEVLDSDGRKLAETGTTVVWGGGQVSAANSATGSFANTLITTSNCKDRSDNYWVVGKIQSPRFEADN
jgi:hypothetical protein